MDRLVHAPRGRVVRQAWIGSEADAHQASRGRAWVPDREFMQSRSRTPPIPYEQTLFLSVCADYAAGVDAAGLAWEQAEPMQAAEMMLVVRLALPRGADLGRFEIDARTRVELGVMTLLAGKRAEARAHLISARGRLSSDQTLERLIGLCGDQP